MLLRFVAGRAGSGKSTWVYEAVKRDMAESSLPVYIVVPEQYTLQTEKELLAALGSRGFMQARVTSPTRLAEEVFSQVEQDRKTAVGECGLAMALRSVASGIAGELQAFRPVMGFHGFSVGMVRLIAELKRFDVLPEDIATASQEARGALKAKTQDVAAIYQRYNEYLSSRSFVDGNDRFNGFIANIAKAGFLRGCRVYFDGFDHLSPQHCRMIGELVAIAESVTVTQDYDGYESADRELFLAARDNAARLTDIAGQLGAEIKWHHLRAGDRQSVMPPDIAHLERNLFAFPAANAERTRGVTVCRARDMEEEIEAAAVWIVERVRQGGLRWREVAVQCGDLSSYGPAVGRVFARHGIPVFIDSRKAIIGHPAVRFILSLVKVVERDFRADDVLRLVKTGFTGVQAEDADRLEMYLTQFALRGAKAWARDWAKGQDAYDLPALNACRKAVHGLVQSLVRAAGGKKVLGSRWAGALYGLLTERKLDEHLDEKAQELKQAGLTEEGAVTERVWNVIIDILDQLHEILGEEELDVAGFGDVLESGFESVEEGIIPTGVDQVQVGSIGRSKYSGLKHMLIIGAADGSLTEAGESGGIFTGRDFDALQSLGIELGRGSALKASQKRFALYEAVTKGSEGLYISWPLRVGSGEAKPDRIVERVMELLQIGPEGILEASELVAQPSTAAGSYARLPALLRRLAEGGEAQTQRAAVWLLGWFAREAHYRDRVRGLARSALGENPGEYLPAMVNKLSGVATVSASQLETYGDCPFKYFVEYVLTPGQWREHGIESVDAGKFLHAAMERFSKSLATFRFDVTGLSETQIAAMMARETEGLRAEFDYGVLASSARLQWAGSNLGRICSTAALSFARQLNFGSFVPLGQEIRFGRGGMPAAPLLLSDGSFSYLQGRIDRLDVCGLPDTDLLRVIDYKSGKTTIDLFDAVNGIDTQTWLYLYALQAMWGGFRQRSCTPAGAYIFPLINPWVEEGPNEEAERRKQQRLVGWCLKDGNVLAAMDSRAAGGRSELYNFNAARGSGVYDQSVVSSALQLIAGRAGRSIAEIKKGHMAALPWRSGKKSACERCPWSALCRFEVREGRRYRQLMDKETIKKMLGMGGEAKDDGVDN